MRDSTHWVGDGCDPPHPPIGGLPDPNETSRQTDGAVRVLRVIEYVYKDVDRMLEDMPRWTTSYKTPTMTMRSAHLLPEAIQWSNGA